jgi:ectoine hydroxylase-related dioxygenase (phytanoyl-CoA dioxygenase family)
MSNPDVAALARDSRLLSLASDFVGQSAVPFRATLFEKSGQRNWLIAWHQDTGLPLAQRNGDPEWGPWTLKHGQLHAIAPAWALEHVIALRLHLDDSTSANGPLRVIPNSHTSGVLPAPAIAERAANGPIVECSVPAGGVVAMRPLLVHASSKSLTEAPRRVLHLEYADSLQLAPGIDLALA